MGLLLTTKIDDTFELNGKVCRVNMAFNNILLMFEMFDDDLILDVEKTFIAIQMLINENKFNSYEEAAALFKYLMKEFLDIDLDNVGDVDGKKFFDFKKDAELIYASFYATYKIDLFEMHGKLHWKKFLALLNHLDDDSKFKQVIGIRAMKIPSANESSQEYRDHIINMKNVYSLDDISAEQEMTNTLTNFASILKAKAKGGEQNGS